MQREHQLQIPLRLGNPQLGKSVDFAFFELAVQHRGARSALGMALVLRCPRISTRYQHKICYRIRITALTLYGLSKSYLR